MASDMDCGMNGSLTVNEVAHLASVPARRVEKAIETGILKPVKRPHMVSKKPARHLSISAVCYLAAVGRSSVLGDVSIKRKKHLMKIIGAMPARRLTSVELEPGLHLDLPLIAGPACCEALRYIESRKRHITTNPEIFGGAPIITGTRIPVYVVRDRLDDGDTLEDLMVDYPHIPRDAFVAADIYARTHPERGRPVSGGRPWDAAA